MILLGVGGCRIEDRLVSAWRAKKVDKVVAKGPRSRVVEGKILHIQPETAVVTDLDEFIDVFYPSLLSIGRHAHYFILPTIDLKTEKSSERRIEKSKRMRKLDFAEQLNFYDSCLLSRPN